MESPPLATLQHDECRRDGAPGVATVSLRKRASSGAAMLAALVLVLVIVSGCEQTTVGAVLRHRRLAAQYYDEAAMVVERANAAQQFVLAELEQVTTATVTATTHAAAPRGLDWQHEMLVFVHVPKAGGSVVKQVLIAWGAHSGKPVADHEFPFLNAPEVKQTAFISMWGHRGYGVHRQRGWKTSKRAKYITFLRNPLDRVVSQCVDKQLISFRSRASYRRLFPSLPTPLAHARARNTRRYEYRMARMWKRFKEPRMDFMRWFNSTRSRDPSSPWHVADNPNVRQLCCWWMPFDGVEGIAPHSEACPSSRDTLACAKKNVDTFFSIGVTERLEDGIDLLVWRSGMKDFRKNYSSGDSSCSFCRGNINRGEKIVLTPRQIAAVQPGIALDVELYAHVKAKFEAEFAEMRAAQASRAEGGAR